MATTIVGDLDVAYAVAGPADGAIVLLLHGWPDDASTWEQVVPHLTQAGFRTIVPSRRGFGATRFRSDAARRPRPALPLAEVNQAIDDSDAGATISPS